MSQVRLKLKIQRKAHTVFNFHAKIPYDFQESTQNCIMFLTEWHKQIWKNLKDLRYGIGQT